ncbi:hypothetical protein FNV43_RR10291 [Rhamnella rubrinervis]|uniref:Protein root UVB sensitive 5 n=1 Tax=Rhamnella rubrinervis TaxID=2594499 RepID=A0A8K0HBL1_9ROSA|nr:hypothetical protein FNV43_RR10291 [Rhamnella rubrinervis]
MALTLQLSLPTCASEYLFTRSTSRTPPRHLQIVCSSTQSSLRQEEEDNQSDHCRSEGQPHVILVERYANGAAKRFLVDDGLQLQIFHEEHRPMSNKSDESQSSYTNLYWLPDIVKDFILPAGFPGSVSNDYLPYMLLQFPTNVTAWICHTLVTSSLLKAVGVGSFSGSTAAASAAAIRWVSKDGIGAVGRLFIGLAVDDLEICLTMIQNNGVYMQTLLAVLEGLCIKHFDLTTPLYPTYFLPLASLGNFAKAIARGLKDPSFRVIQYHFATAGNLGEVAAKEEVWDVAAQLLGLALGILILDTPGLVRSYPILVLTWMVMRFLHLWLRYQSLSVLQFNTINLKRARILVKSHVINSSVPGCIDCNREENILLWQRFMKPRIVFGVPLEEVIGGESSVSMLNALLKLYGKEKYILVVNKHERDYFEVLVSFKVGATSVSVLRSIWQTYWLQENRNTLGNAFDQLAHSLLELEEGFEDFMQQLNRSGWNTQQINLKVPKEVAIEELDPIRSHKIEFY